MILAVVAMAATVLAIVITRDARLVTPYGSGTASLPPGEPASIPEEIINLYRQPLLDSGNGKAPLAMMRMVHAVGQEGG